MNIYLLTRTDRWSYDDHDAAVVIAENADDAKKVPVGYSSSWTTSENIDVKLLGTAVDGIEKIANKNGIILDSFNAG